MNKVFHFLSFGLGWALCLWAAIAQWPLFSWMVSLGLLTVNISLQERRRISIAKVLVVLLLGFVFELVNRHLGFYEFPKNEAWYPPSWLLAFWPAFSLLFMEILDDLASRPLWSHFLIGLSGGAVYFCGEYVNLIRFHEPKIVTFSLFCVLWSVEYILLVKLSRAAGRLWFLQRD